MEDPRVSAGAWEPLLCPGLEREGGTRIPEPQNHEKHNCTFNCGVACTLSHLDTIRYNSEKKDSHLHFLISRPMDSDFEVDSTI